MRQTGRHPNKVGVEGADIDAVKEAIAAADYGRGKYTIEGITTLFEGIKQCKSLVSLR